LNDAKTSSKNFSAEKFLEEVFVYAGASTFLKWKEFLAFKGINGIEKYKICWHGSCIYK